MFPHHYRLCVFLAGIPQKPRLLRFSTPITTIETVGLRWCLAALFFSFVIHLGNLWGQRLINLVNRTNSDLFTNSIMRSQMKVGVLGQGGWDIHLCVANYNPSLTYINASHPLVDKPRCGGGGGERGRGSSRILKSASFPSLTS